MELIINIPEESYKFAKECKSKGSSKHSWNLSHNDIVLMIANGTPLSKGHGKLIDAHELIKTMFAYITDKNKTHEAKYVMSVAKGMVDIQKPIVEADKAGNEEVHQAEDISEERE